MKIATFNINNINRRLPNLLQWLKAAKPDVVCLQELKCTDEAFPAAAIIAGRLSVGVAWAADLEWSCDPGALGAGRDPDGAAGKRRR